MTQQDNHSGATGIGDDDIDQDGRADTPPSQAETGGSGGAGLTRHEGDDDNNSNSDDDSDTAIGPASRAGLHPATESGALGADDTRLDQAGANRDTGLGSAETGANQAPDDLAPVSRAPDA